VLFTTIRSDRSEVSVLGFASGRTKTLIQDAGSGVYVEPAYRVYAIPGSLRARRFDLQRMEALGESVPVLEGVRSETAAAAFAASRNGLLVFAPGASGVAERRSIVWVDRSGREQSVGVPLHAYFHPRLSRDDARLAVAARDEDQDMWLWDFKQPALTKLTSGSARELNPVWLPDNEHLLYASRTKSGVVQVFSVRADGAGVATQVTSGSDSLWPISVTPDGLTAVVVSLPPANTQQQLALVHLAGNGRLESLLTGKSRIINGEVSPDGQWLAYQSNETAREEIYVRPFPNVKGATTRIAAGMQPAWCRTGSELFYLDADGYLTQVTIESGTPGTPHRVLDRRYSGNNVGRTYDISRDCQRFVMLKGEASIPTDTPLRMTLLVDWIEDLKRVLPPH
jgi:serine/threonine-protein kinase